MTSQEAIDIIRMAIAQVEWDYPMDYAAAFEMAIEALKSVSADAFEDRRTGECTGN